MKRFFFLTLLLVFSVLFAGCDQNSNSNAEPSPETEYEINAGEDNAIMEKSIDFDLENTIRVLKDALVDAEVTAESGIIEILQEVGIRGVVQAQLIDEPGRRLMVEIVSEDENTYRLSVVRRVFSDTTYYTVRAIRDMQSGELIYSEECGLGYVNP